MHDESPDAAGTHVSLLRRDGEAGRPPPLADVARVGPGPENAFAPRVKGARNHDVAVCGRVRIVARRHHLRYLRGVFQSRDYACADSSSSRRSMVSVAPDSIPDSSM